MKIHFKLPVFQLGNGVKKEKSDKYLIANPQETPVNQPDQKTPLPYYSTVTDLAKFLGWSTLQLRITAIW